tara:strand:+ start:117 stop:473 length:357 start_codon:yes stop_codon:yes gene_type:complete
MHIIYDEHNNEYGVLKKEPFKKVLRDSFKSYAKTAPTLGPEHLFWNGGKKIDPDEDPTESMPEDTLKIGVPVVSFYDNNKKVYDRAMYTSEHAKERYKVIKTINNLNEFFKFRKEKYE